MADTPGAVKAFRVSHRTGDQQLVAAAKSILAAATPLHDQFVAHNLPATFADDLTAAIGAFEQAIDAQSQAVESRAGARANISAAIADALTTVARLDPVVENRLKDDPGLLAEWRTARHVSRLAMPHPKGDRPGAPAAPPPAPATPPLG